MGPLGMQEMIGLFVIALLLFGPKKLPELGRTLGKALTEFRRAKNELKATFETHMNELEKETRIEPAKEFTPSSYSYPYDDFGRYEEPVPQVESGETHHLGEVHQVAEGHQNVVADMHEPAVPATPVHAGVNGTIARSNGIQPVGQPVEQPAKALVDQEHPS